MSAAPDLLADAIRHCDDEPIHRPGAIQPHGRLLVLEAGAVVARSLNLPDQPLDALFAPAPAARLRAAAAAAGETLLDELPTADGAHWSALLHPVPGGRVFVELEPASADAPLRSRLLNETLSGLQRAQHLHDACAEAVRAIAALTGFDRVMAYRFLPDWSGEVVAEHLRPGVAGFLGLRFPASDIPPQARALYAGARVRTIADCAAAPVPIEAAHAGLDLSACTLRAVSPVHLQYLANMGVRASMSVAVLGSDGLLWGLIACHHEQSPLPVGPALRQAADTIGRALAWRVSDLAREDAARGRARVGDDGEPLAAALASPEGDPGAALAPFASRLLAIVGADAFLLDGPTQAAPLIDSGAGPGPAAPILPPAILATTILATTLDGTAPGGHLLTDRLAATLPPAIATPLAEAGYCGLLAERVADAVPGVQPGTWAVWLRAELRQRVDWAGNPDKSGVATPDGLPKLTPRRSFASWREEVRGRSAPFSAADAAAGRRLAEILARALLRRAEAAARLHRELLQRHDDLRFFADAAVHDLREPLWQIQVFSSTLREDLAAVAAPDAAARVTPAEIAALVETAAVVEGSAARMRLLVDALSHFATSGRHASLTDRIELADPIAEATADLAERIRAAGAGIVVELGQLPPLRGDAAQLRRLFQNLLSNAIKYRHPERPLAIRAETLPAPPGRVRLRLADNGIGFPQDEAERIFEPFRRLDAVPADGADGMGLGLAICRRIAEAHAGAITAEGRPGEGAAFVVDLPVAGPSE